MQVRPFALLGGRRLAQLRDALDSALASWADDWGLAAQTAGVLRAWEAPPHSAPWQYARQGSDGRTVWLAWPAELPAQLQRQLFAPERRHGPPSAPAPLAQSVAEAALAALAAGLAQHLLGGVSVAAPSQPPAGCRDHASGAVAFEVGVGPLVLHGLLNHAALQALAPAPAAPPLPALELASALAPQPLHLQVAVGQAEVTLGSLLALQAGDVIRLDSLAERPLAVRDAAGKVLFGGYLGTEEGKLALEAVPGNQIGVKV